MYPEEQFIIGKTVEEIAESIASCGYVCGMCYETIKRPCLGCRNSEEVCPIKLCCGSRNICGCWECDEFPCCECNFRSVRIRAFLKCARDEGIKALAGYLVTNLNKGIHYHYGDTYIGDYDQCRTENEVLNLLHEGKL